MKRVATLLCFILMALGASAREVVNINRDWRFFMNSEGSSERAFNVNFPHTWNNDALSGKRDYTRGMGNYVKNMMIPLSWKGKRVFVKLYGANTVTTLLVNGRTAGEHNGGYTAFAFEITDLIVPGKENALWLIVNNSPRTDVLPTAGDMNVYGGCFRDVELIVTEPVTFSLTDHGSQGVYVNPRKVTDSEVNAEVELKIDGLSDKNVMAKVSVFTDEGTVVAEGNGRIKVAERETVGLTIPFSFDNPILWNGRENPHMYNIGVKLTVDGRLCDSIVIRTGFRYYSISVDEGFKLNGKPYPIRGVNVTQDRAMAGPAITRYQIEEDMRLIDEIGANAVRVMGVPHNPYFYELCDALGLVVWSDLPWLGNAYYTDRQFVNTPAFMNDGRRQLIEIIRQQYNHPSVMIWGLFSDLGMRGDNPINYIKELNKLAKTEDPYRFTGATSSEDGEMNFITDLIIWNHSMGWKDGYPSDVKIWLNQMHRNWKNLRSAISYSAGGSILQQDDELVRPAYLGSWHPERWQTYFHEQYLANTADDKLLWGTFVGNLFDYGAAGRDWGEGNGINDSGLVTFDRKYRKDAFFLYQASWKTNETVVYIAEKRWEKRTSAKHDFKVYTNSPQVELFVNGISQGVKQRDKDVILTWKGVKLERGMNRIEARSDNVSDTALIFFDNPDRSPRRTPVKP